MFTCLVLLFVLFLLVLIDYCGCFCLFAYGDFVVDYCMLVIAY